MAVFSRVTPVFVLFGAACCAHSSSFVRVLLVGFFRSGTSSRSASCLVLLRPSVVGCLSSGGVIMI